MGDASSNGLLARTDTKPTNYGEIQHSHGTLKVLTYRRVVCQIGIDVSKVPVTTMLTL